jgi:hypothetical protein
MQAVGGDFLLEHLSIVDHGGEFHPYIVQAALRWRKAVHA